MRKQIFTWIFVLAALSGHAQARDAEPAVGTMRDSVVKQTAFFFPRGAGEWIEKSELGKMRDLAKWAKANPATSITIRGWADSTGTERLNKNLSQLRARTVSYHLKMRGVDPARISVQGCGVDFDAQSNPLARRVDVCALTSVAVAPQIVEQPAVEQPAAVEVPQPVEQTPSTVQPAPVVAEQPVYTKPLPAPSRWYIGIEAGVPFAVSDFTSFASAKTYVGWQAGVLAGYRFSPLLALELGASLGQTRLGSGACCEEYWLGADGAHYLSPVAGMPSYSYRDIYASVAMQQYALRLHVDLLQIANARWDKRWSLNFSPAIYGVGTKATLKSSGNNNRIVSRNSQFQFGVGAGLGVGYQITKAFGIGLRSGAVWVFGEHFDGITPINHKENLIWNNTVTLTWRFAPNNKK